MYDLVFGPDAEAIVELRSELAELLGDINDAVTELEELQDAVLDRLDAYEAILLEELPGIQDLSAPGNPFAGMREETVSVGDTTRTVRVGFEIDQAQAVQQTEEYDTLREGFADYQDAFIKRAELLDSRLRELDEVLFQSEEALAVLMERYAATYADMVRYTSEFVDYQRVNADQARANLRESAAMPIPDDLAGSFPAGASVWPTEAVLHQRMQATAEDLSAEELDRWNDLRITLINFFLDLQGVEDEWDATTDGEIEMDPIMMFVESGLELWWRMPTYGWTQSIELADDRIDAALASFHDNGGAFTTSWAAATGISDEVFDRKADLYTILFEVYDQLAVYGSGMIEVDELGNAVGEPTIGPLRPREWADEMLTVSADTWTLVTIYFERQRTEVTPYLEIPSITEMTGTLRSDNEHTALLSGGYDATHPVAVVEYACRAYQGGVYMPWLSVGTARVFADLFVRGHTVERNHFFDVRARGAGGLTIERSSGFDLEFYDPETDAAPFVSSVDTSDDSPPSQPWVGLAETTTANPEELYAQWRASDDQSGIQRYEYAVGTWSADGDDAPPPTDVVPWTSAGGRTEAIIKELALEHGHEYVVSVRATNGVGLRSTGSSQPVLVDLTPPQGIEITRFVQETVDRKSVV